MDNPNDSQKVLSQIDKDRILSVELGAVKIPSLSFEEQEIADFYAGAMTDIGLDVEMMEVQHPKDPETTSRQPIGRLTGTGGGPTLMLNGHMDTNKLMSGWTVDPYGGKFEDGWVWGHGCADDKGGLTAAIGAVDALVRSGVKLKGDIIVCPVVGHKMGGIGTRTLLSKGVTADCCINMEHSANTIATTCTGSIRAKITTRNTGLFFRYSEEARARYLNAIEQQAQVVLAFSTSIDPAATSQWCTFTPHPDLPGFPMHRFDRIMKEHYGRECDLFMQVRTVPGQTLEQMRSDITKVLEGLKVRISNFEYELVVPEGGPNDTFFQQPMEIEKDHPLVVALIEGQRIASGREPEVGGVLRVGNFGDGNVLAEAGIPSLQYGPGDCRLYPEWPTPDERVELRELVEAATAIAYAAHKVCG
jgi:acetylornithine deacetylase/succinyl-diaminopimelate desuccinylase-like protein